MKSGDLFGLNKGNYCMAIMKSLTQGKIKVITGCALMTFVITAFSADHGDMDMADHAGMADQGDMADHGDKKDRISAPEGMKIQIIEPPEDAKFSADDRIMIKVEGGGWNTSHDHWHLYLDGELQAMVGGGRTSYELMPSALSSGEHVISVTVSNSSHEEYDIGDKRMIWIDHDM